MPDAGIEDSTFRELVDYVCGDLSEEGRRQISKAIEGSSAMASVATALERLIGALRDSGIDDPPAELVTRVRDLTTMGLWVGADPEPVIAMLTQDSREHSALMGYRGAPSTYQMAFEVEGVEILFQMSETGENQLGDQRVSVMAQIDGLDEEETTAGGTIAVVSIGGEPVAQCGFDQHGYFSCTLRAGTYDVIVETSRRRIVVPAIEIG